MPNKQPQIVILLGRSGCGKGTQAQSLQKEFAFNYLGSGKVLRKHAQDKDFTGRRLKKVLDDGTLVPVFLISRIWSQEIEELKENGSFKGLLIDGSPRRLLEARLMSDIFKWYGWKNIKVILIDISEKEAFDRLSKRRVCEKCGRVIPWLNKFKELKRCNKCGGELKTRSDDNHEAIQSRMNYYKKEVVPVIKYYKKKRCLITIDGERPIEEVYQDIAKQIAGGK